MKIVLFSVLIVVLLIACSSKEDEDHVFKTQEKALDKAKALQSTIEEKAAQTKEQLEQVQ